MTDIDINNFEKNIHELLKQTITSNDAMKVSTPDGNVIVVNEEYYNNLIETLYFYDIPTMKEKSNEIKNQ